MKKIIKNNIKLIIGIIIGTLISGGVVYAAVAASAVTYSNTNSGLKDSNGNNVTNVQDAIDVLYKKANSVINYDKVGDAVIVGGYIWHVIGENNEKVWLLMDAGQLPNMNHCRTGSSSNCTWNGSYYVYSWENSLISDYLNTTFYNALIANNSSLANKIVETKVCKDSSLYSSDTWSYGGYTEEEIITLQKTYPSITCNSGYTSDKVRLVSQSEYFNLTNYSSYTSITSYPYLVSGYGSENGKGYIPKVGYIQNRVSNASWLYSSTTCTTTMVQILMAFAQL